MRLRPASLRRTARKRRGILKYMLRHGSRLAGVVRAGAYALYERPVFPVSGTDQVYGTNVARFLADGDVADQLVLSLYVPLALAMTPNTFCRVRLRSVALPRRQALPLDVPAAERGEQRRLPGDAQAALVHETRELRAR